MLERFNVGVDGDRLAEFPGSTTEKFDVCSLKPLKNELCGVLHAVFIQLLILHMHNNINSHVSDQSRVSVCEAKVDVLSSSRRMMMMMMECEQLLVTAIFFLFTLPSSHRSLCASHQY